MSSRVKSTNLAIIARKENKKAIMREKSQTRKSRSKSRKEARNYKYHLLIENDNNFVSYSKNNQQQAQAKQVQAKQAQAKQVQAKQVQAKQAQAKQPIWQKQINEFKSFISEWSSLINKPPVSMKYINNQEHPIKLQKLNICETVIENFLPQEINILLKQNLAAMQIQSAFKKFKLYRNYQNLQDIIETELIEFNSRRYKSDTWVNLRCEWIYDDIKFSLENTIQENENRELYNKSIDYIINLAILIICNCKPENSLPSLYKHYIRKLNKYKLEYLESNDNKLYLHTLFIINNINPLIKYLKSCLSKSLKYYNNLFDSL